MQDAASRRGQGGTHRCNPPNSSLCLLEHPVGCIIDNSTELDTAILHCGALQHVQMSLAQYCVTNTNQGYNEYICSSVDSGY